jgi:hypothetical protein
VKRKQNVGFVTCQRSEIKSNSIAIFAPVIAAEKRVTHEK